MGIPLLTSQLVRLACPLRGLPASQPQPAGSRSHSARATITASARPRSPRRQPSRPTSSSSWATTCTTTSIDGACHATPSAAPGRSARSRRHCSSAPSLSCHRLSSAGSFTRSRASCRARRRAARGARMTWMGCAQTMPCSRPSPSSSRCARECSMCWPRGWVCSLGRARSAATPSLRDRGSRLRRRARAEAARGT
jgi:hypothetical protein